MDLAASFAVGLAAAVIILAAAVIISTLLLMVFPGRGDRL